MTDTTEVAMKNKVTVTIERETLNRVRTFGKMGDTYDYVLNQLMDEVEEYRKASSKRAK